MTSARLSIMFKHLGGKNGKMAKTKLQLWHILVVGALLIILTPMLMRYGDVITESIWPTPPGEPPTGTVAVNKDLSISVFDKFAGNVVTGAWVGLYEGTTKLENLTDKNDGTYETATPYPSGKELNVYVNKTTAKAWYTVTVPYMTPADAQSATLNNIRVDFFGRSSLTMLIMDSDGNNYTQGDDINVTTLGKTLISLTISQYVSTDNTGYVSSYDLVNKLNWYPLLTARANGTGYENVVLTGFNNAYEKGSNMYYSHKLKDSDVTKLRT